MKKRTFIFLIALYLIPASAIALDQMNDKELDRVTARFGIGAVQDAAPLTVPPADASAIAGNITPTTPPASLTVQAILDGSYANDRGDDTTRMTTFFTNMNNLRIAATFGFF